MVAAAGLEVDGEVRNGWVDGWVGWDGRRGLGWDVKRRGGLGYKGLQKDKD